MKDDRWSALDSAVVSKLHSCNSLSERVKLLEDTIYEEGAKLFGHVPAKRLRNLAGNNRRTIRSINLIKLKNSLLGQISSSFNLVQKAALGQLLVQVRSKIRCMRCSEKSRKKRWRFKRAQAAFRGNPYNAGKALLDPKVKATLSVNQTTLDEHKQSSVFDHLYDVPLEDLEGLPPAPSSSKSFNSSTLKYEDFEHLLSTRRNASSPGLNAIPYKVYKKCPQISAFLFNIFKCCVKKCIVPVQWRYAKEIYIPKSKTPVNSNVKDFRPIALLNVEGKLLFSLISKRLEAHIITNNKFINTSIQKGCMEKVPGCWEHMSMVWSALKEARSNKTDLSTIWLDIANAYGSIPHRLIFFALERYGVPHSWISLIKNYYVGIYSKSFSEFAPSNWHQHLRGIFAGCTLSIILFLAGINIILEYTLLSPAPSFITSSKLSLPLIRAFMDDINLMSSTVSGAQSLLDRCATALKWAGMDFRAEKSRSFVVIKGKSLNSTPFSASKPSDPTDFSSYIPSIHSNPVKFLGRVIDGSISDRKSVHELDQKLSDGLNIIDKSCYKGSQKLWILQHLLIPRIQWPLLIYEVSISVASRLEQKVSSFIRKWLHLHHSTTNICLYSSSSPCPLPIKSLTSILKSSKISGHLLLRDSQDPLVSGSTPVLKSGSWKVEEAVRSAEAELHFKTIRGPPQFGRAGLGMSKRPTLPKMKNSHEYRKLVSDTSKEISEEENLCKAVQLQVQGQWTRWENYVKHDLSWNDILATPPNLLSFCLSSTYDVLPSPNNLKRWHICTESSCFLCNKEVCTTAHVLGGCQSSLNQGRFTFRHDSVLKELAETLKVFLSELPSTPPKKVNKISFVKKGSFVPKSKYKPTGILHLTDDWVLLSDLDSSYVFPGHIAVSSLRPDIVIFSNSLKRVVLVELTCPCEENMERWHSTKLAKYSCLVNTITSNGWGADLFAIEVGARGYCSRSVTLCLRRLGFSNKLAFSTTKKVGLTCMKSSFCIWLARNSKAWSQDLLPSSSQPSPVKVSKVKSPLSSIPEDSEVSFNPSSLAKSDSLKKDTQSSSERVKHAGLINKGNTCYANSILQVLSVIPSLWSQSSSETPCLSQLVKSVAHIMSLLNRSSPVDPSKFLRALERKISSIREAPFNCNTQQDVPEILRMLLDEFKGSSALAEDIFSTTLQSTVTCDTCFCSSVKEDKFDILTLSTKKNISASLNHLLQSESLSGDNMWSCPQCSSKQDATIESIMTKSGKVLIMQLKRYDNYQDNVFIDSKHVTCLPYSDHLLKVPIKVGDNVSFSNDYSLIATINHSGTFNAGHYWAFIKERDSWLKCNDSSVLKVHSSNLNNSSCYVLFYVKN